MSQLRILGVRHHSPACARLVRDVIARARPWAVLIEGPSDLNPVLGELLRPHTLPIAVYSYCLPRQPPGADRAAAAAAHGSWAPFCAYSPEWVALRDGHAAGAVVRFIDLPAWDPAFTGVENRYSDHEHQVGRALRELAVRRGFDSSDALWDHLFELGDDLAQLERDLAEYFAGFRGPLTAGDGGVPRADLAGRDPAREAYMTRWIDWAMRSAPDDATVLVVCGGFHQPALRALAGTTPRTDAEPEVPVPDPALARTGSYLVPFSFHRLDSFTGYASGMPSPAYYQAVWDHGARAGEHMMFAAITRLRRRGQPVSTADAVAASELAHGLARLRGHRALARSDVLDGLAGALIKDALRAPPPWSGRGPLAAGTEPYLVEILRAFSGDTRGALAEGTARPPLVDDIEQTCAAVGLIWRDEPTVVTIDIHDRGAVARRQTLYRLLWLELPGVELVATADLRRGRTRVTETWRLCRHDATTAAMIERAGFGATLEAAALARITERLHDADGVAAIVGHLERALRAGFHHLIEGLCAAASAAAEREPQFARAGLALDRLTALQATEPLPPGRDLGVLIGAVLERALWLLEGIEGAAAPFDRGTVAGIAAIRAALDLPLPALPAIAAMCVGVWTRRLAAATAPPAVRGACLGALWTSAARVAEAEATIARDHAGAAEAAVRGIATPVLGELLGGLFALAREAFRDSELLGLIDARLATLDDPEFLATLPSLRRAFAFFPPGERRELARRLVQRHRGAAGGVEPHALIEPVAEPEVIARVHALEQRWFGLAARYGLLAPTTPEPA